MSDRRGELLRAYRETLERMEVPLTTSWLVEHEVTADEVHQLVSDVLARLRFPEEWAEAMRPTR